MRTNKSYENSVLFSYNKQKVHSVFGNLLEEFNKKKWNDSNQIKKSNKSSLYDFIIKYTMKIRHFHRKISYKVNRFLFGEKLSYSELLVENWKRIIFKGYETKTDYPSLFDRTCLPLIKKLERRMLKYRTEKLINSNGIFAMQDDMNKYFALTTLKQRNERRKLYGIATVLLDEKDE